MRTLMLMLLTTAACATTSNPYSYEEMSSCPPSMDAEEHQSGVVRCRAMCSSYAREFAEYDHECKCRCAPAAGGGYRPQAGTHQG
jgi:hypothetical protein